MLSLLLGFAQAHVKHSTRKQTAAYVSDKAVFIDPKDLEQFMSKDPRYVKVYSPKETSVANGGGVTKAYISNKVAYLYLSDNDTKNVCAGCSIAAIISGFIPEGMVSKVVGAVCSISGIIIGNANRGRGVVFRVPLGGGFPSLSAQ